MAMQVTNEPKEKHVYSREKLFEIRDTMPESLNSPPNIDKNLESEVMTMLFGDNRRRTWQPGPRSRPRYERRRNGNWRDRTSDNPHFLSRRPSLTCASQPWTLFTGISNKNNERGQERRIIERETVEPLRRSANRFIPSCQKQPDGQQNQLIFVKTLRSHLNKISKENYAVLSDKITNLMKHEYTGDDRVSTFTEMVLAKVVFDRGLCTEVYVKLCQSALDQTQLKTFSEALLKSSRDVFPRLKQTKEAVAATKFVAELIGQKLLNDGILNKVVELLSEEDNLQTVAKCHIVKSAKPQDLPFICPKLYDSWAYSIAWSLTEPIPKRVKFLCEDAIKVARKNRSKPFRVISEPVPDTVGMWFGRN